MTETKTGFTTEPANGGERTVLMIGWQVEAVFIGAGHAELAAKVAGLLNREEEDGSE